MDLPLNKRRGANYPASAMAFTAVVPRDRRVDANGLLNNPTRWIID